MVESVGNAPTSSALQANANLSQLTFLGRRVFTVELIPVNLVGSHPTNLLD